MYTNNTHNTVYIKAFGCPMREVDSEKLKNYFLKNKFIITKSPSQAFYKIYITCGLNNTKAHISINAIGQNNTDEGVYFVTGCLPSMMPDLFEAKDNVKLIPIKEIDALDAYFEKFEFKYHQAEDGNNYDEEQDTKYCLKSPVETERNNFSRFRKVLKQVKQGLFYEKGIRSENCTIRISDGCIFNCSFCGIKNAIGKHRSKPVEVCCSEYKMLLNKGYRNFIFLADDPGSYGIDIKIKFIDLLSSFDHISSKYNDVKWILQCLSPNWAIRQKEQFKYFLNKNIFYEILFTIQSGNNRILDLMNRKYKIEETMEILRFFRKESPEMRLLTCFIIGFPTETEAEFDDTCKLIENFKFDFVYLMKYYENSVCESRNLLPKVPESEIEARVLKASEILKMQKTPCFTV